MRAILVAMRFFLLTLLLCPAALPAQSTAQAVRAVLDRQVADWNRGDVRAFMQGYDKADATLFVGTSVVRGYQRVLDNYLAHYATRDQMGALTFSNLEVLPLGKDHALVLGNFQLERTAGGGGNSDGIFTLTFEKKRGAWKIIADHTSASAPPRRD
jgi:ketosteroid isomerase-like protein